MLPILCAAMLLIDGVIFQRDRYKMHKRVTEHMQHTCCISRKKEKKKHLMKADEQDP